VILSPTQDGSLSGSVILTTNDPDRESLAIPIRPIAVQTLPSAIAVLSEDLDFGDIEVGRAASRALTVRNDGQGVLRVAGVSSDVPGVSVDPSSFEVSPGEAATLTVTLSAGDEATLAGDLRIHSNDPDLPVVMVFLRAAGVVILADPRTDFNADGRVDFVDFLQFVQAFNTGSPAHDLNDDGRVAFEDFLLFVRSYARPLP
jgi:hypothetical protein